MLQEPMMEKLTAMRLLGMADALKAQEQDPGFARTKLPGAARSASGSAVDLARESSAGASLARRQAQGDACVEEIDYRASRGLDKSVIRALAQKSAWAART